MTNLTQEQCVACRKDSPRVTGADIAELKPQIPEWNIVEHHDTECVKPFETAQV
jgi:4a-hydroxytetrahydrobiopterin dehydratase